MYWLTFSPIAHASFLLLTPALPAARPRCEPRVRRVTGRYIFSLSPRLMSQAFTGQAVKKPTIMPICIMNQ